MGLPTIGNYVSLCSGTGMLDAAIRLACPGSRCRCYVEIEAFAIEILVSRMQDGSLCDAPIWSDLTTFDPQPWNGHIEMVVGGFPCQDISHAGKGEGIKEGNRSGLWYEFERVIRYMEPRYVFLENVAAITLRGLDIVLGDLARLGYDAEWTMLKASDVGASHQRKRWFCLARLADAKDDGRSRGQGSNPDRQRILSTEQGAGPGRDGGAGKLVGREPDVANTGCECLPRRTQLHSGGMGGKTAATASPFGESDADMGHADLTRLAGRSDGDGGRADSGPAGTAGLPDGTVGDTSGKRRREGRTEPELRSGRDTVGDASLPLFPPGPGDRDAWAAILRDHPDLAPATEIESQIRVLADGRPARLAGFRVDQLRALGNGVVPLQAALAFVELHKRLTRE